MTGCEGGNPLLDVAREFCAMGCSLMALIMYLPPPCASMTSRVLKLHDPSSMAMAMVLACVKSSICEAWAQGRDVTLPANKHEQGGALWHEGQSWPF